MNLINSSFIKLIPSLIATLGFLVIAGNCHSQFIKNTKAQVLQSESYFNSQAIKRKRIKTITVTFFNKKELRGINQIKGKSNHFLFDEEGRIERFYYTNNFYSNKSDTLVEWRYYKNNKLITVKQASDKNIRVKSIFYEDDKQAIQILGTSYNLSNNLTTININSYQEKSAEYITHKVLRNGDKVTEWSFTDKTVFERLVISQKDSVTVQEIHSFPVNDNNYSSFEYSYKNNLLTEMVERKSNKLDYYYSFHYDSNKNLVGYSKYTSKWESEIEVAELLYNEGTGNLQAILIKNKINNSIKIRKFNYTYF